MATTIKLKNSVTTTNAPSSLVQGEVAINITDKKVWVGNAATTPIQLLGDGGSVNFTTVDTTNLQVTNIKAKDGTASAGIANSTGAFTVAAAFAANGGATLGDASGDALTINSSAVSIPNGLNFDSNTLVIDATNNYVGINAASPTFELQVEANRNAFGGAFVRNLNTGSSAAGSLSVSSAVGNLILRAYSAANSVWPNAVTISSDSGFTGGLNILAGGANPLVLHTNSTERMRITSTGNVGIGTSSPAAKLDVNGSTTVSSQVNVAAIIGPHVTSDLLLGSITGNTPFIASQGAYPLTFYTNAAERMRIDSSGNVGIGVNSPLTRLQVYKDTSGEYMRVGTNDAAGSRSLVFSSFTAGGTTGAAHNLNAVSSVGEISFSTNSAERMRIDSSGNVGIGTSTPLASYNAALAVVSPNTFGTITAKCTATSGAAGVFVQNDANTADCFMYAFNSASGSLNAAVGTSKAQPLTFLTNNSEKMRIDSSGNVGIGGTPVSVASTKTLTIYDATEARIQLQNSTSGATSTDGSTIAVAGADLYINNRENGNQLFFVNGSERMRITSGGELVVGTTTADGLARFYRTTSGDVVVAQNTNNANHGNFVSRRAGTSGYAIYFDCAGNQAGTITHPTTTSTNYGSGSDYRLKDNIQPLDNALNIVGQLKPSKWTWKTDGSEDSGFIAHELQELFPSAVTGKKDDIDENGNPIYQCVDTSFLVATLAAAIQELKAELDATKAEVALLKSK